MRTGARGAGEAGTATPGVERIYTRGFITLFLAEVAAFMSFYVLLPVVPLYILDLGGDESTVGWLMAVSGLVGLVATPFYGRAIDRWGRKTFLLIGLAINAVSAGSLALVRAVGFLVAPLALRAVGSSGSGTASRTLVIDISPGARRGEAISNFLIAHNVAIASGPAVGLALLHTWGFRAPFFAAAGLCVLSFLLAATVREPRRVTAERATGGKGGGWLVREAVFPSVVQLLLSLSYVSAIIFLSLLGEERGIGGYQLFFTVYAVVVISVRVLAGRVSDRYGRAAVILPALGFQALCLVLLSVAASLPVLLAAAVCLGLGWGAAYPALTALTADRVGPSQRGMGMGILTSFGALGSSLGTASMGNLVQRVGFTGGFLFTSSMVLLALLIAATGLKRAGELTLRPSRPSA